MGIQPVWGTVHPRACGEQASRIIDDGAAVGSSPRLRGTGKKFRNSTGKERFIPAPAGNSTQIN